MESIDQPLQLLSFPSGPVSLHSKLYIDRPPIEALAYAEIEKPGSILRIKASRETGKSSLLNRIVAHAKSKGYRTACIDLQEADHAVFASLERFLRWFSVNLSRMLQLNSQVNEYWDEEVGSKVSCTLYFQEYLLKHTEGTLVLALNEVDRVFEHPQVAQEFLQMLRSWYEKAKQTEIWQRFRLVMTYSTEAYIALNINQSPFNVGLPLRLPPFTVEQVQDLAQRYGLDWDTPDEATTNYNVAWLMEMVGGHPYLINLAFYSLQQGETTLDQLLQLAPTEAGIYNTHLRRLLTQLQTDSTLEDAFRLVVSSTNPVKLEAIVTYKLDSLGLVTLDGDRVIPSCELYRLYFRNQLIQFKQQPPKPQRLEDSGSRIKNSAVQIEHLEQENQRLKHLSYLDELTQLGNRRYFETYFLAQWKRATREQTCLSLIFLDIDYFKLYNDFYGRLNGDACLQRVAAVMRACVKQPGDLVTRYGGEEFAVILPQTDQSGAVRVAEIMREQIKAMAIACDYPGIDGLPAPVLTLSAGVASIVPTPEDDPITLVYRSEQSLHKAKQQGRDRSIVYSSD